MRFLFAVPAIALALAGCVSNAARREANLQRLLAAGEYRRAIDEIERGTRPAGYRFTLGLLYAYREIEDRGEMADFTGAVREIRADAAETEAARTFLADYEQRGSQAFYALPWAHLIGPFPEVRRPQITEKPNRT